MNLGGCRWIFPGNFGDFWESQMGLGVNLVDLGISGRVLRGIGDILG